ncbi:MAG: hypothetical protein HC886_22880 [Leptolyngbyaceae cyanobacterium SM1_1_3]|nr:hypothetical protein [Leptolyngbyaceae cyanobacterium SM1_1_3]NJN04022.1 hypothetical protein [Leptolyngbyaceae cyanobacterium RM1_1_2]NJO09770.1 hypothetical protein [Leptolyngbyaceae cyanobacterium SL_1_1]
MDLAKFLALRSNFSLLQQFLTIAAAVSVLGSFAVSCRPAQAEIETANEATVIDLPVSAQITDSALIEQAELLVGREVSRQFSQNSALSEVQVVVVGSRYGEVVPILSTAVSRTQWQQTPQVSAWTQYYSASYALLQRHGEEAIAAAPVRGNATNRPFQLAQVNQAAIDAAYDENRLTTAEAQAYLSNLD